MFDLSDPRYFSGPWGKTIKQYDSMRVGQFARHMIAAPFSSYKSRCSSCMAAIRMNHVRDFPQRLKE